MAYDDDLADRVRAAIEDPAGLTEKKMFGGHAFLLHGRMAVAASGQGGLLLRVDPADTDTWVREEHVTRYVMRGKEMDGWLHVGTAAVATDEALRRWVEVGTSYARSLPPK